MGWRNDTRLRARNRKAACLALAVVIGAVASASPAMAQNGDSAGCAKVTGALEAFMNNRQIESMPGGKTMLKMAMGDKTLEIPAELAAHCG